MEAAARHPVAAHLPVRHRAVARQVAAVVAAAAAAAAAVAVARPAVLHNMAIGMDLD